MVFWKRVLSIVGPVRFIGAIGGVYVLIAVIRAVYRYDRGVSPSSVLIVTLLIVAPGLFLVYGARWLSHSDIDPEFSPDVAEWSLAGFGAIAAILLLYHVQPEGGLTNPQTSLPVLMALSTVAGFGVGIYDGQAKTRTRELERRNEELHRIQTELEETITRLGESNERLEQFAYAASHDLQEPLRMVSSYLQLIENRYEDELDADGKEFLEFAVDGAERMRAMIDGLLQYSRIDTHGDPLEPVDLNDILASVRDDLQVKIDESNAAITADSLPRVVGDRDQLRQLFQNLLDNAMEYSGDDPPRVHVTATQSGDWWQLSVADEGVGIDPDDKDRIFDVFQRLHTHEEHAGTGIGLALCERIVERPGGEIWVESAQGDGTTFSFTLSTLGRDDD